MINAVVTEVIHEKVVDKAMSISPPLPPSLINMNFLASQLGYKANNSGDNTKYYVISHLSVFGIKRLPFFNMPDSFKNIYKPFFIDFSEFLA